MGKISRKLKFITNPKKNEKVFKKQNISWGIDICMLKKQINVYVLGQGIFVL